VKILRKLFGPRDSYVPPLTEEEAEKQVVKERLNDVQQRLRALSAEADVLAGNLGDVVEEL
jgi:tetrahydromethanopterin S-methyltransferase subunit G